MGDLKADMKTTAEEGEAKQPITSKKGEHAQRSSFFTWFFVLAMLGAWTSVAVVWLDLVDYKDVLARAKDMHSNFSEMLQGHLGVYDADGDGDFDMEDAKVLLGLVGDGRREKVNVSETEEASGWFYDFLFFLYDVMTPFEIQEGEEESEPAVEVADELVAEEVILKKAEPKENTLIRDVEWNLREALKRQMSILHERVEAKKIAKIALAEVRSLVVKEAKAKRAQKAIKAKSEAAAVKPKEKAKKRPKKKDEKAEGARVVEGLTKRRREKREKAKVAKKMGTEQRKKAEKEKRTGRKRGSDREEKAGRGRKGTRDRGERPSKEVPKAAPRKSSTDSSWPSTTEAPKQSDKGNKK